MLIGHNGFFARRWRGEIALSRVFWRDMLGVGTVINLFASFVALIMAAKGLDNRLAVAMHFAPVPFNVFLFLVVWSSPQRRLWMSLGAAAWLAITTVV